MKSISIDAKRRLHNRSSVDVRNFTGRPVKGDQEMSLLPITSLVGGSMALLLVLLSVQVSFRRRKTQAVFGDANDETLRRRIRAHGNFVEYAPLALIVVGLMEYRSAASWLVGLLGVAFVLSRVLHALGMLFTATPTLRAIAMLINHASFLTAGIWLVIHSI
jgi:uncharacterized membrane protein YecN with MAPEG domain